MPRCAMALTHKYIKEVSSTNVFWWWGMPHTYCQHSISLVFAVIQKDNVLTFWTTCQSQMVQVKIVISLTALYLLSDTFWNKILINDDFQRWHIVVHTYKLCVDTHWYLFHKECIPSSVNWAFTHIWMPKPYQCTKYHSLLNQIQPFTVIQIAMTRTDGTNDPNGVHAKKGHSQISSIIQEH